MEFDVFVDNCVFRNALRFDQPEQAAMFDNALTTMVQILSGRKKAYFVTTPLMLLEFCGIVLKPLSYNAEISDRLEEILKAIPFDADQVISNLISFMTEELRKSPLLSYDFLNSKVCEQKRYQHPSSFPIITSSFEDNLKDARTENRFLNELAIDELQGLNFREIYGSLANDKRLSKLIMQMSRFITDDTFNVALSRLLHRFYAADVSGILGNGIGVFDYVFSADKQDRLDTQMTHFACVGNKRDGRCNPVVCFTFERSDRIRARIASYLPYIRHLAQNLPFAYEPRRGKVVQLDQNTARIKDIIDVNEIENSY